MKYQDIQAFDQYTSAGTSLMILSDTPLQPPLEQAIAKLFPVKSALKPPLYRGPVASATDLEQELDLTITALRDALTESETKQKGKMDDGPSQINGSAGVSS
ncbi:MAG: hypothetical protein H0W08_23045 [Acidobacteria bacterium]|nr:hypothetical protein [Acidobacteriota bacterium]